MKKSRKYLIYIGIPVVLMLLFGLTYIPHKIFNIDAAEVSKITIFNGGTGQETEITDKSAIRHIVDNLNDVTFQKGKWAYFYMGFSFKTTVYSERGKPLAELTINSSDTIRYKGFFYKAKGSLIDYEYIQQQIIGDVP